MLWKCPACSLSIRHSEQEAAPRRGVVYRCHICRLELALDEKTDKLSLAPLPENVRFKPARDAGNWPES